MQYTCEKVKEMLSLYIDEELCDDEKEAVKVHLEACGACKSEYEFLHGIISAANAMPAISADADFHARIMQAATNLPAAKPARRSLWRMASGFVAAAAVIAISVISLNSLPGHPDLTKAPETEIQTPATQAPTPAGHTEAPNVATPSETVTPQTVTTQPSAPAELPSPAVAAQEEPVAPAIEEVPAAISVEDQPAILGRTAEAVTCYYIGEASYEDAVLILDVYEFDGIAYLIPLAEKDAVYEKLQALPDFVRYTEEGDNEETVRIALACE